MERKKQKETEEQQKQVKEDEQLAGLPAWKRAIVLKQREKEKKDGPTTPLKPEQQNVPGKSNSAGVTKSDSLSSEPQTTQAFPEKPALPKSESDDRLAKFGSATEKRVGSLPKSQSFDVLAKTDSSEKRTGVLSKPEPIPENQVAKPDSSSDQQQQGAGSSKPQLTSLERQTTSVPRSDSIGKLAATFSKTALPQKPPSTSAPTRPDPLGKTKTTVPKATEQTATTTVTTAPDIPKDTAKQPQPPMPSTAGKAVSLSNAPPTVAENNIPQLSAQPPIAQPPVAEVRVEQPEAPPPVAQDAVVLPPPSQATDELPPTSGQDESTARVSNRNSQEISASEAPLPAAANPTDSQPQKLQKVKSAEEDSSKGPPIPAWKKALLERKKLGQPVVPQGAERPTATEPPLATVTLKPVQKLTGKFTTPAAAPPNVAPMVAPAAVLPDPKGTLNVKPKTVPTATQPTTAKSLPPKVTPLLSTPKVMPAEMSEATTVANPAVLLSAPKVTPGGQTAPNLATSEGSIVENAEQKKPSSTVTKPAVPKSSVPTTLPVTKPPLPSQRTSTSSVLAPNPNPTPAPAPPTLASQPAPPTLPEIITSETKEPLKLFQREGVELRPPIFQEVKEWANVPENDPQFQSLPPWKQALIMRRREDIARRSGQSVSKPTPDKQGNTPASIQPNKTSPVSTPSQPVIGDKVTSGLVSDQTTGGINKKAGDQVASDKAKAKPSGPSTGADSKPIVGTARGQTTGKPSLSQANSNRSEDLGSTQPSNVKALLGKFKSGPKDKDPAKDSSLSAPTTPNQGPKVKVPTGGGTTTQTKASTPEPLKIGGLKPHPFSPPPDQLSPMRPSPGNDAEPPSPSPCPTSPGTADQESEDSDLEVTNIDDVLEDTVDSECSAPIIVQSIQSDAFLPQESAPTPMKTNGLNQGTKSSSSINKSNKVLSTAPTITTTTSPTSPTQKAPPTFPTQKTPPTSPTQKTPPPSPMSPTSPTGGAVKSILVGGEGIPKKKVIRRVSWSDSTLVVHHEYPKYTYDDYDDMQEAKEINEEQEGEAPDGGGQVLELPVHPMLQTTKANRDPYSAPPKTAASTPQSPSIFNNKLSIMASYGSLLESHLNDKGYLAGAEGDAKNNATPTTAPPAAKESKDNSEQPDASAYSTDVAALIW